MKKSRSFRNAFRRKFRRQKKQATAVAEQSNDQFERYFIQRLNRLPKVWRFTTGWLLLFVLLIGCVVAQIHALGGYYQTKKPVGGGIYTEGVLGSFTNANPMYAVSEVDKTVSKLVFAGLLRYDKDNQLVGNLASDWSIDATGKIYTVTLKPNLTWQDGQPLTAQDVAFTFKAIQSPDADSPLRSGWEGIAITAENKHTVQFTLPNPLSSFAYNLTTGIVPEHILGDVPMAGMRSVSFNTVSPIGAGPFKWNDIDVQGNTPEEAEEIIGLVPFENFQAGPPKLHSFIVHAYATQKAMVDDYLDNQLVAISGLTSVPPRIKQDKSSHTYNLPMTAAKMVFFKTTQGVLKDPMVRQALVQAADPKKTISALDYSARPVREPLLDGQLGYDKAYAQQTGNPEEAKKTLDNAGWLMTPDGYRAKNGERLTFTLTALDSGENARAAEILKQQWQAIGVDAQVQLLPEDVFRATLAGHAYDAVLYAISVGADPDVFVYWHSSQADVRAVNRLNLSEYGGGISDDALEAGRTRSASELRAIKYKTFLQQWQKDAPALGLYQPRYIYITHEKVYGLDERDINEATDRLNNANEWMIRTARVTND